jgi:hypothetical protein
MNTVSWRMAVVMIRLAAMALMPFVQSCGRDGGDPPSPILKEGANMVWPGHPRQQRDSPPP